MNQATCFHVFPSFTIGGAQIVTLRAIRHMPESFRHIILSQNTQPSISALRLAEDAGVSEIIGPFEERLQNPWKRTKGMRRLLAKYQPDLLISYNWGTIEWSLASALSPKLRHVHQEHGFGPEESQQQLPRRRLARRGLLKLVDGLVVPSRLLKRLAGHSWGVASKRIHHVANAVDPDIFTPALHSNVLPSKKPFIIGTAVPLRREKRLDQLIDAIALLPADLSYEVRIYGYGQQRPELERQVTQLDLDHRIRFMGAVDSTAQVLRDFDLFIMSSETEQMPMAILEAMASGLPVICTDVGDVRHMLSAANKPYIVPFGDTQAMATAVRQLIDNPAICAELGQTNRRKVLNDYDERDMASRLTEIYSTIMRRPELHLS